MTRPPDPVAEWTETGLPRSRLFGDVYFSSDDGLAESRTVFLSGCGLPQAWSGRRQFTVGELGFGTGLNISALLSLWAGSRPTGARLNVFSIEAHPLTAAEARRALMRWPELTPVAELLLARWPGRARGFHRIDVPEFGATIDVAVLEAAEALASWSGPADAWFLDGFSPALNPEMWRQEVLDLVARRSAPGARAATYTVAGAVRRGLAAAGFEVARAPGHGRKRERLEARLPGAVIGPPPPRVAVIGAGIAGAAASRALRALGAEPVVLDAQGAGAGASGGPAGLMAPRLDAGLGPGAALFAQGARRAADLFASVPGAVLARGAVQLPTGPKDAGRFAAIEASDLFEPGAMVRLGAAEAGERLGEAAEDGGLLIEGAMTVEPRLVLETWLPQVQRARVARLERANGVWRLLGEDGAMICEAEAVVITAAAEAARLAPQLPTLTPVRGQATIAPGERLGQAVSFGAYAIPARAGVLFGATHDRQDADAAPRAADRARNLAALAAGLPGLAERLASATLKDWSAIRATTRDYLPLAGPAPGAEGLFVLAGLGSRGLCLAPLLGEHVAALIVGAPSPLPRPLAAIVDPARFAEREARKGRPRKSGVTG